MDKLRYISLLSLLSPLNASKNEIIEDERMYNLVEEQFLLATSLLDQLSELSMVKADVNRWHLKIYCQEQPSQILSDAKWLLNYINNGKKISGYLFEIQRLFAKKQLKQRLYIINEIYYKNAPCNNAERLEVVINQLDISKKLERIAEIWDMPFKEFESLCKKYHFFKHTNNTAKNLLIQHRTKELNRGIDDFLIRKAN
jgi:hypothetical protein